MILTKLQSEVQAFKQTFLRAVDIVEQMGHTMDSLEMMENSMWNETTLWQNGTRRRRRHAIYPLKEEKEAPLVRKLADQMRTLPLEKVRQIRSGKHVFGFLRNIFVPQSFFLWAQVLNYLIVIKVTIFSCRRT